MDFSQKHPEQKGKLWSTRNTTFSVKDGQTQKAMGMIPGVSDLIYYNGRFVGIEIKVRGTSHSAKHVERQLKWGGMIKDAGGEWFIVTSLEEFWEVINGNPVEYTVERVKELLNQSKTKIKF